MGKIRLLDCTLRDGGYINDWKFGHDHLVSVFERLVDAGVDIIEIGFLDERRPFDPDRSIMPDTDSVEKIYGGLDRRGTMVVGMIDYGTCGLSHIRPRSESFLDGIRVIFKKHLMEPAMQLCAELKALGYEVFAQLVSVTSYSDAEMLRLIELANAVEPFAVSMVDTYGLMHQDDLMHYFRLLDAHLLPHIGIGYHAHNNFQMGYANCIAMLAYETDRDKIVDGTIYGMGKSAGNAPIELIMMHMDHKLGKSYNISQVLEAIDTSISLFYQTPTWGYSMLYYLAASNDCHPNYVAYLMNKRTLSVRSINEILGALEGERKLLYDQQYAETLYRAYQTNEINDAAAYAALRPLLRERPLLVIGPGRTVREEADRIAAFIRAEDPLILSINYVPETVEPSYLFVSNSKRYVQLASKLLHGRYRVIATSNVSGTSKDAFDYVLNFSTLIDPEAVYIDNSLVMLLKVLCRAGVETVTLAGFDGYSPDSANYLYPGMEYDHVRQRADYLNSYTRRIIADMKDTLAVRFLTTTRYTEEDDA